MKKLGLFLMAVLFLARVVSATSFLPEYSIDENEVVETTVAMLGGDFDYRFYKYGPLTMYGLAAVYSAEALLTGRSLSEFAGGVFFDPYEHYLSARVFCISLIAMTALMVLLKGRRYFGEKAAFLAAMIVSLPLIDNLIGFTIRIDVTQALCQTLALLAALDIVKQGRWRDYALFGLAAGLAIAAKPLPGLLILPTLAVAQLLNTGRGVRFSLRLPLVAFGATLLAHSLANPFSLIHFREFVAVQRQVVATDASLGWMVGYDLARFLTPFGWPLCILFASALADAVIRPTRVTVVTASFVFMYFGAFALMPARDYFYVPLIPPLALLAARSLVDLFARFPTWRFRQVAYGVLALVVALPAVSALASKAVLAVDRRADFAGVSAASAAKAWIEANVPSGSGIVYFGWYPFGPRIVADGKADQAQFAQYFWQGRGKSKFFVRSFVRAYERQIADGGPRYKVYQVGGAPGSQQIGHGLLNVPRDVLVTANGVEVLGPQAAEFYRHVDAKYLVLVGGEAHAKVVDETPWLRSSEAREVAHFPPRHSAEVSIFQLHFAPEPGPVTAILP